MEDAWEVVVVSANFKIRQHLAGMLSRLGIHFIYVSSVDQCRDLRRGSIGLVFCDRLVKGGDYRDVLSAFSSDSANPKPKVVMISELADAEEYQRARRLGLFDVIPLPCRPPDIEWMVIQARRAWRKELLRSSELPMLHKTARAGI